MHNTCLTTRSISGMLFALICCLLWASVYAEEKAVLDQYAQLEGVLPGVGQASSLWSQQYQEEDGRPSYDFTSAKSFGIDDWQLAIDTTWGPGFDTAVEWQIYKGFWDYLDYFFVCFNGITVDWDSIRAADSAEIAGEVSRGRFIAMMQYASWELSEGHTMIYDDLVSYEYRPAPGKPLLITGDWGACAHFGAGSTLGLDGSLFVYQVGYQHPLGLEPGDLILGYNGVTWEEMYPLLLAENVPIVAWSSTGSTEGSRSHRMMSVVGRNWHMFDTIDIVKYSTGDTIHFPTSMMTGSTAYSMNTEQVDIPGVPKPDFFSGQMCSWGIVSGTDIGYIYVYQWAGDAGTQFFNAIDSLMNRHPLAGLIVDYRLNWGGSFFSQMEGLSLLFDDTVSTLDWYLRCNTSDRYALCENSYPPLVYQIPGDPGSSFRRPIAVLVGPGAGGAGEWAAFALSLHPSVKFFGKPTDGAFSAPAVLTPHADFEQRYAQWEAYPVSNPSMTLTRKSFPNPIDFPDVPYEEVWLTREGVAQGRDDVVEAAIEWITTECCVGLTGNVDGDIADVIDIGDLTALISYMFIPPFQEPSCLGEANADGVGAVDIGDLTALISYLFIPPFPEPTACP